MLRLPRALLPRWRYWPAISLSCLVLLGPVGFWLPPIVQSARQTKHTAAEATQISNPEFLGLGSEAWTALFTLALTVSTLMLWFQTRSAARESVKSLKTVERAYLFWDFRQSFIVDVTTGILTLDFCAHNSGKTPAIVFEVYGEIAQTLPVVPRTYANAERKMKIDISVQADAQGRLGKTTYPTPPQQGYAVLGYAIYRDVFGDEHKTGFAAVYNANTVPPQWEGSGPGCEPWNYWS